jgi:hypothetical protein
MLIFFAVAAILASAGGLPVNGDFSSGAWAGSGATWHQSGGAVDGGAWCEIGPMGAARGKAVPADMGPGEYKLDYYVNGDIPAGAFAIEVVGQNAGVLYSQPASGNFTDWTIQSGGNFNVPAGAGQLTVTYSYNPAAASPASISFGIDNFSLNPIVRLCQPRRQPTRSASR